VIFVLLDLLVTPDGKCANAKTSDATEKHVNDMFECGMISVIHYET
jgi:hypothetical protein